MTCTFTQEKIEETIAFHGHSCPGLAIGIRAAELALSKLGRDTDMVTVTETDMCGVDAIQYLTDCTYGKGNLIHRDYGKMAFNFYDRKTGKGFRALYQPEKEEGKPPRNVIDLTEKVTNGTASYDEKLEYEGTRVKTIEKIMRAGLEKLFEVRPAELPIPGKARVLKSLRCGICGEMTMESRTRQFDGKTLCLPCFEKVEQQL